jgi:hypothetical protein
LIAYKFLAAGSVGPFSNFAWPAPGQWVEARATRLCFQGVHACRARALPYWLDEELWRVELGDPVEEAERKLVGLRGRLLERVEGWDMGARVEFGAMCAERTKALVSADERLVGYAEDAAAHGASGNAGAAGFIAARVADLRGGADAYEAERAEQARWLATRLGVD